MPEDYSAGKLKHLLHGIDYQKLCLMLFFRRAVDRKYFFRLATEMSSAAGFDDIVFRYEQNGTTVYMLIQVKHKQDGSKKICIGDLLTKSGELNLVKHFAAFLEIQGNEEFKDKIKDFFIITNVDFDHESLGVWSQSVIVYYHHHLRSHYGTNITWVRQSNRGSA